MTDLFKSWALAYVERGWWVHPLRPGSKVPVDQCRGCASAKARAKANGEPTPATPQDCPACQQADGVFPHTRDWPCHGFHLASSDPALVERWWSYPPWRAANVGLACGRSGVTVLDYDVRNDPAWAENCAGREVPLALDLLSDRIPGGLPDTLTSLTGGGGIHLVCSTARVPADRSIPGKVSGVAGIDIKGTGAADPYRRGYVLLPPSFAHPETGGKAYRWHPGHWDEMLIADLPRALWEPPPTFGPSPTLGPLSGPHSPPQGVSGDYGAKPLREECANVASAGEGARHHTLTQAAFRLGTLAGAGLLDQTAAKESLHAAGLRCGLPEHEVRSTVADCFAAGMKAPRSVPARPSTAWRRA